jgi:hypothetical protein
MAGLGGIRVVIAGFGVIVRVVCVGLQNINVNDCLYIIKSAFIIRILI